MEKPLEEAIIKIPVKPLVAADIESDLILREAVVDPEVVVEPEIGVEAEEEVAIGALEKVIDEVIGAAEDAISSEIIEEPFIGPSIDLQTEAVVQSETPTVTQDEEQIIEQPVNADTESAHANSLVHLLPANTFAQISPRSYLFPGAEVTLNNMDGAEDSDTDGEYSDDEEEENDENESASANASEIIVPDIDTVLSNEVPLASPAPTCGTASPTPSTSQLQCNDPETAENITEIQADDANEDLEPVPIKRPRLNADAEAIF